MLNNAPSLLAETPCSAFTCVCRAAAYARAAPVGWTAPWQSPTSRSPSTSLKGIVEASRSEEEGKDMAADDS